MDQVFILQGLGFGDDEDHFENISAHQTREGAEARRDEMIGEMGLTLADFNIDVMNLTA